MPEPGGLHNRVKARRLAMGWSQEELARRAGVSRAAVSAVEVGRLVPSVAAALGLAGALGCSVEELFGAGRKGSEAGPSWAWPPVVGAGRFWRASVGGRTLLYPAEPTPGGVLAHDGTHRNGELRADDGPEPSRTLVLACCDPAAGLLAAEYERATGFRLLVLPRSSARALALLRDGLVHVAGVHLESDGDDGNARAVAETLGEPSALIRAARWEEGLALAPSVPAKTVRSAVRSRLAWVGREPGSGARRCLDRMLPGLPEPARVAFDHRGVAEAIRCGWAEAGVCLRLAAEEAGLRVLGLQVEGYDLCIPRRFEGDPRVLALVRVIRSPAYRRLFGALPGYDADDAGESRAVSGPQPAERGGGPGEEGL